MLRAVLFGTISEQWPAVLIGFLWLKWILWVARMAKSPEPNSGTGKNSWQNALKLQVGVRNVNVKSTLSVRSGNVDS